MGKRIVVIDVGGTNLRIASIRDGRLEAIRSFPSIAPLPPPQGFRFLEERIRELAGEDLEAVVLGFPGLISKNGRLHHSPNLRGYEGLELHKGLLGLDVPIFVENDANLYALGEGFKGAARGRKNFCCLTLGTGVGSGVIIGGKLLKGSEGVGAEIGHMTIKFDGAPCSCGSRGCLEAYCSGSAILRMAREEGLAVGTAKEVADLAMQGEAAALRVFERMGEYLGAGLANIVNIFNPEVIVIGGKVADAFSLFIGKALEVMSRMAFSFAREGVKVLKASLGDEAALWGGLALVEAQHEDQ